MKTMKKTKRKIVVEIKGGCVRSLWVSRDLRGADVTVVDRDGMDEVDGERWSTSTPSWPWQLKGWLRFPRDIGVGCGLGVVHEASDSLGSWRGGVGRE